ncbi:hypothetical protein ACCAA_680003 [Candidatus Accumulibacter aalborgensis]|uniref:Uncharacterized protein n=1 Tax=Candidatus Accumulibacter aalborgensis TaxID=1860102 RepID=A0A1A8XX16_9PROT|nr:hypothetical protein ACCAA_680003 [Candidatus Accumulibacter aalborgensis]
MVSPISRRSCTISTSGWLLVRCRPKRPETSSSATCTPTPERKPVSTVRERKSARKPSPSTRPANISAAAIKASKLHRASHSFEPRTAMPARPAATTAAVAESAPTARCRDDPKMANRLIGMRMVYKPVITGVPMILVYPIVPGMASAASVKPAMMSRPSPDRSTGRTPWKTGSLKPCPSLSCIVVPLSATHPGATSERLAEPEISQNALTYEVHQSPPMRFV